MDCVIPNPYSNLEIYTNSLLTANIIIQTLYDFLKLNSKNINHTSNDTYKLLILLTISRIKNNLCGIGDN